MNRTDNIRVKSLRPLISPSLLLHELPITETAANVVANARQQISDILHGKDNRLVVIVGPCSIHDTKAAMDYANRLHKLAIQYKDRLCIIMRVYFEKPRTTIGWKGLINDPDLTGKFDINKGLKTARKLLLDINELGLPTGSEFLDTIIPQYISDLTSWSAIGARTTESQIHRELASGLSMPVGFKNGTTGNIQIAIDAICAANGSHHFLGVSEEGLAAIVSTKGNPDSHVILRGGSLGPNYDAKTIANTIELSHKNNLPKRLMIDCSHGNSQKNYTRQVSVLADVCQQIKNGSQHIFGVMLESNLVEGKQTVTKGKDLVYGQSITDACIGWDQTEHAMQMLSDALGKE
jgi:3-deoxy-7-phosphoheptulonate synthase